MTNEGRGLLNSYNEGEQLSLVSKVIREIKVIQIGQMLM